MDYDDVQVTSDSPGQLAFLVRALVVGVLASLPMALVWVQLANPPQVQVTQQGAFLGELELSRIVNQPGWLIVVGLVAGLILGFAAAAFAPRKPVTALVGVLVISTVAILMTGWLGHHVFGPDHDQQAATVQVGDYVRSEVQGGTWVAYLGGPIGGLAGALLAISALWPRDKVTQSWPKAPALVSEGTTRSSTV